MRDRHDWMWAGALGALARAEQLHRQFFQPSASQPRQARWEPPVDVLETDNEVLVIAALPGVVASEVQVIIDGPFLIIAGERRILDALRTAAIHRMELPQGRFERRIPLPRGAYDRISREMIDGCLVICLNKMA